MNIESYNNQIEQTKIEINDSSLKLEQISTQIQAAINIYIKEELYNVVENNVKLNAEHTKRLGLEQLKELKSELSALVANTENLVKKHLNNSVWVHRNYSLQNVADEFSYKYNRAQDYKRNIDTIIRELLGYAGELLIKYKYVNSSDSSWEKKNGSSVLRYRYGITLSNELYQLIEDYKENFNKFHDATVKINNLRKDKEKQEAIDLWEQA